MPVPLDSFAPIASALSLVHLVRSLAVANVSISKAITIIAAHVPSDVPAVRSARQANVCVHKV